MSKLQEKPSTLQARCELPPIKKSTELTQGGPLVNSLLCGQIPKNLQLSLILYLTVTVTPMKRKENEIFLIYKEIQMGSLEKSYMKKGFLIYEEMCKYLTVYEEAVSHI
jgi:hypothetical protein